MIHDNLKISVESITNESISFKMFFFSFSQQFSSLFASPNMQIKPLQRSVAFHIETSHLIFLAISYADNFNKSSEKLTNNK